jgi:catechol 2,3-dioxygenase-like lactoylglutathione lyase family enzyme
MVTIDCADPQALGAFWSAALDLPVATDVGDYVYLAKPAGGGIVVSLQKVPEPRVGKNRVHLDLTGNRATEVPRLVALGATVAREHVVPGTAWTVLEDPEGNVFCVGEDA